MAVGELFRLTTGVIPLDRGGLFKFGNFENRKGAAKPRPLCTPLGLFLSSARDSLFLFVDVSVCFGIQRATLCRCCFISSLSLWFTSGKVSVFFGIQRTTLCRCCFISSLSLWFSSGKVSVFFGTQRTTLCRCCFISSLSLWFTSGKVPVCFDIQCATLCRYYFISSLSL